MEAVATMSNAQFKVLTFKWNIFLTEALERVKKEIIDPIKFTDHLEKKNSKIVVNEIDKPHWSQIKLVFVCFNTFKLIHRCARKLKGNA